ncbi:MAG: hypothetical protein H7X97_08730, partial [Opitutaceae bacterium]|nr:hypothetical protein [Verrucomicrobiales bacterium]
TDFTLPAGSMLMLEHRIETPADAPSGRVAGIPSAGTRVGTVGDLFDVYVRTANGNLYTLGGRMRPSGQWQVEAQTVEGLTMAFWGRTQLPWRYRENVPASLVYFL